MSLNAPRDQAGGDEHGSARCHPDSRERCVAGGRYVVSLREPIRPHSAARQDRLAVSIVFHFHKVKGQPREGYAALPGCL